MEVVNARQATEREELAAETSRLEAAARHDLRERQMAAEKAHMAAVATDAKEWREKVRAAWVFLRTFLCTKSAIAG